jgi:cell division cycle 14
VSDRLLFVPFSRPPSCVSLPPSHSLLCTDALLTYHPFYEDFGPFHLGCTVRFCAAVDDLLAISPTQRVVVHCNSTREAKSNAAVLIGCYAVWKLRRSVEEAYEPLRQFEPYAPFRDASIGPHTYKLSPLDCISAFAIGLRVGLFDPSAFSVDEYEHFESVEHGDLNVVVPGRFIAFASPSPASASAHPAGYVPYTPNMYLPIFRHFHVTAVVRLNQSSYSPAPFISHGIRHAEMVFPDGSNPPQTVVHRFIQLCDDEESRGGGVIAVHCKVSAAESHRQTSTATVG